jgi:hypothetical protein
VLAVAVSAGTVEVECDGRRQTLTAGAQRSFPEPRGK